MSRFIECSLEDGVVDRARAGDTRAHELIYRTFCNPVYNLALRITGQTQAAEEVLQDTFVEVLTRIGGFRGEAPAGAWIREIALNKCLMHLRSGWHRKIRSLSGPDADGGPAQPAAGIVLEYTDEHLDLERALARLPAITRMVIWLHDVEGYTHHEIGGLMNRSASFSKSQLARAHKRLQDRLAMKTREDNACNFRTITEHP